MKTTQHRNLAGCNPFKFMHKPKFNSYIDYNSRGVMILRPSSMYSVKPTQGLLSEELPLAGYSVNLNCSQYSMQVPMGGKVDFGMTFDLNP